MSQGKTAALLEEKKADVFEARVGYLPPGKTCFITISYMTQVRETRHHTHSTAISLATHPTKKRKHALKP
jgi:hypothetical protein